jgi:hypothetical protein
MKKVTQSEGILVYIGEDNSFFVAHKDHTNPVRKTPSLKDPIPVSTKEKIWEVVNDIADKVHKGKLV